MGRQDIINARLAVVWDVHSAGSQSRLVVPIYWGIDKKGCAWFISYRYINKGQMPSDVEVVPIATKTRYSKAGDLEEPLAYLDQPSTKWRGEIRSKPSRYPTAALTTPGQVHACSSVMLPRCPSVTVMACTLCVPMW